MQKVIYLIEQQQRGFVVIIVFTKEKLCIRYGIKIYSAEINLPLLVLLKTKIKFSISKGIYRRERH